METKSPKSHSFKSVYTQELNTPSTKNNKLKNFLDIKINSEKSSEKKTSLKSTISLYRSKQTVVDLKSQSKSALTKSFIDILNKGDTSQRLKTVQSISSEKKFVHPFRHLRFGKVVSEKNLMKYLVMTQTGLIYSTNCLKNPSENFLKAKSVSLPCQQSNKKKVLFLDLDETLIHSCEKAQVYVKTMNEKKELVQIGLNIRPNLESFFKKVTPHYQVYAFTASSPAYATAIVDFIDPKQQYILGMLTRGNCMETKNGFFIKDLRIIQDIQLENMIIVDNLVHSFGFQIDNGVPIAEWIDDQNDDELVGLGNYLVEASKAPDIREFNRGRLKLRELTNFNLEKY